MQDWMGVVLFGTEESDTNSGWKHIQNIQELRVVTLDDLQRIRKLSKDNYSQTIKFTLIFYFNTNHNFMNFQ